MSLKLIINNDLRLGVRRENILRKMDEKMSRYIAERHETVKIMKDLNKNQNMYSGTEFYGKTLICISVS